MKWTRRLNLIGAAAAVAVLGFGSQAHAQGPLSTNSGWVYTFPSNGGAAFFDADLNGYPGVEKLTVCDNKSNGRGIVAYVLTEPGRGYWERTDPSNNGSCTSVQGNEFAEEDSVELKVCEYWHESGVLRLANCAYWFGYA